MPKSDPAPDKWTGADDCPLGCNLAPESHCQNCGSCHRTSQHGK